MTKTSTAGHVAGFDHVALPMQNTEAMLEFYRKLGFEVEDGRNAACVYAGEQMIRFHSRRAGNGHRLPCEGQPPNLAAATCVSSGAARPNR